MPFARKSQIGNAKTLNCENNSQTLDTLTNNSISPGQIAATSVAACTALDALYVTGGSNICRW